MGVLTMIIQSAINKQIEIRGYVAREFSDYSQTIVFCAGLYTVDLTQCVESKNTQSL